MGMYKTLFIVGLIVAITCLLLAVVLFFVLKIPKALGVVTGRSEKKAIEEIRANGYESRAKKDHASHDRIRVRDAEMDTGALGKSSSSGEISVREVSADTAKTTNRRAGRGRVGKDLELENEETEILGAESAISGSAKAKDFSDSENYDEGATDVLGAESTAGGYEDATDVLSGDGSSGRSAGQTFRESYEDETDVLSGDGSVRQAAKQAADRSYEEEETDVLTSGNRDMSGRVNAAPGYDDADETDVLTSGMNATPADEEILGRYSAEETAVLRSIHSKQDGGESQTKGIRIIYSETIVHTEERL